MSDGVKIALGGFVAFSVGVMSYAIYREQLKRMKRKDYMRGYRAGRKHPK